MTQTSDLLTRRTQLLAEVEELQRQLAASDLDLAEAAQLDAARAALQQVEASLATSREALARNEALKAYKDLITKQRSNTARQRDVSAKVAHLLERIKNDMSDAKPLIREHQTLTAASPIIIARLYSLAGQAGGGLDPMKDIDANDGGPIDPSFIRLLGLG
jgi:hypothetical protein